MMSKICFKSLLCHSLQKPRNNYNKPFGGNDLKECKHQLTPSIVWCHSPSKTNRNLYVP